jgi:membrane-bound lytic murein transglycosylase MltF
MLSKRHAFVWIAICLIVAAPMAALDSTDLLYRPVFKAKRNFTQMKTQRIIRVLTTHNMTNFFVDKGQPRGFEYELLAEYEKFLNQDIKRRELQIELVVIPLAFKDLLPSLLEGFGDIVAAGLTITPARAAQVAFSDPYLQDVSEVVVTSAEVTGLERLTDLAGRRVLLQAGSSFDHHVQDLNRRFAAQGLDPFQVTYLPQPLVSENALEMVHAGIAEMTVTDRHVAELWAGVLSNLRVQPHLKLHSGGQLAWAVRPDNPQLLAHVNAFLAHHKKGTLLGNIFFKRYFQNTKWILNPTSEREQSRIRTLRRTFETYSAKYGFDWLLMGAQGFQESRLDQSLRSRAGAVGIMQLLPSTARDMGFDDITSADNNIHAGIKYMDFIRRHYFNEPEIASAAKVDFSLAAYNAGPNRVRRWRKQAAQEGFDPNRWFNHVEWVALQEIGSETVRYVANINKYYLAYRLMFNWQSLRDEARNAEEKKLGR